MPIPNEVLDPAIESMNNYQGGRPYNKQPLKAIRGILDGMCPKEKRRLGIRATPAFRKHRDYLEKPIARALSNNGRQAPENDVGVHMAVRAAIDTTGQLVKSTGKEVDTERQRLRNNVRWVRDFLINLRVSAPMARAAAD